MAHCPSGKSWRVSLICEVDNGRPKECLNWIWNKYNRSSKTYLFALIWIDIDNIDVDDDDVDNDDDDSRLQVWVHAKQRQNVAEEHGVISHVL